MAGVPATEISQASLAPACTVAEIAALLPPSLHNPQAFSDVHANTANTMQDPATADANTAAQADTNSEAFKPPVAQLVDGVSDKAKQAQMCPATTADSPEPLPEAASSQFAAVPTSKASASTGKTALASTAAQFCTAVSTAETAKAVSKHARPQLWQVQYSLHCGLVTVQQCQAI